MAPIYVFECPQCQSNKEVLRSFKSMEDTEYCEVCPKPTEPPEDGVKMKRVSFPGIGGIHFGKGFFKTGGY